VSAQSRWHSKESSPFPDAMLACPAPLQITHSSSTWPREILVPLVTMRRYKQPYCTQIWEDSS